MLSYDVGPQKESSSHRNKYITTPINIFKLHIDISYDADLNPNKFPSSKRSLTYRSRLEDSNETTAVKYLYIDIPTTCSLFTHANFVKCLKIITRTFKMKMKYNSKMIW